MAGERPVSPQVFSRSLTALVWANRMRVDWGVAASGPGTRSCRDRRRMGTGGAAGSRPDPSARRRRSCEAPAYRAAPDQRAVDQAPRALRARICLTTISAKICAEEIGFVFQHLNLIATLSA